MRLRRETGLRQRRGTCERRARVGSAGDSGNASARRMAAITAAATATGTNTTTCCGHGLPVARRSLSHRTVRGPLRGPLRGGLLVNHGDD